MRSFVLPRAAALAALLAALLLAQPQALAASRDQGPIQRAVAATARLEVYDGREAAWCSGVLVAPTVLLTAAHCVAWADPARATYRVDFGLPRHLAVYTARLLYVTPLTDLAALRLAAPAPVEPVPTGAPIPFAGAKVVAVGFPGASPSPVVSTGKVVAPYVGRALVGASIVPDLTATDIATWPGDSGGPLFDASGRLVGILSGSREPGSGTDAVSVYVCAIDVNLLLSSLELDN